MPRPVDLDRVRRLIRSRELTSLAEEVSPLPTHDATELVDSLPGREAAVVFRLLAKDTAVTVFDRLSTGVQAELVGELGEASTAEVFTSLDPDDLARLLDELPARVARRILAAVHDDRVGAAMLLLGYDPGSVGRHMSPVVLRAQEGETVGAVLERLRSADLDVGAVATIPVLSSERVLRGVVDPLALLRRPADEAVDAVMDTTPRFASTDDDAERVARGVLDRGEVLLPVLDSEQRLVGMLEIADAALIDRSAAAEDHARAGAREPLRRSYLLTPVRTITRSRIVWLLVLAISAVLTVQVLEMFEATLEQQVALALFIPLLTGIGGNTGSQAATTVTRALAVGDVGPRDILRVAAKEVRTGLLLGLLLGAVALGVGSLIYGAGIGTVLGLTLLLNCPVAATVGGVVPLVARVCRVDPAVFSTPFISTFCDASGLLLYFTVAISVLGL
ncbi:magnesium transporter [Georgenia sp. Z1491]|uniref:magnesium transporter n=1 Tax=Georgenia sp. Z1491 TaxID=3416707 RepID=UPI003CEDE9F9